MRKIKRELIITGFLRRIKSIFNRSYRIIDIDEIKEQDPHYSDKKERFFLLAKDFQDKFDLTQKQAIDGLQAKFQIRDIESGKIKSPKRSVDDIIDDFYDDYDLDLIMDLDWYIPDEY